MEDLIPDMKEKIADMRDMKSEAQKKIAEIVRFFFNNHGADFSVSVEIRSLILLFIPTLI